MPVRVSAPAPGSAEIIAVAAVCTVRRSRVRAPPAAIWKSYGATGVLPEPKPSMAVTNPGLLSVRRPPPVSTIGLRTTRADERENAPVGSTMWLEPAGQASTAAPVFTVCTASRSEQSPSALSSSALVVTVIDVAAPAGGASVNETRPKAASNATTTNRGVMRNFLAMTPPQDCDRGSIGRWRRPGSEPQLIGQADGFVGPVHHPDHALAPSRVLQGRVDLAPVGPADRVGRLLEHLGQEPRVLDAGGRHAESHDPLIAVPPGLAEAVEVGVEHGLV